MITKMPVFATPILGTRLWFELGTTPSVYAPKPRRTQTGIDVHNSTGVSAWAERRLR